VPKTHHSLFRPRESRRRRDEWGERRMFHESETQNKSERLSRKWYENEFGYGWARYGAKGSLTFAFAKITEQNLENRIGTKNKIDGGETKTPIAAHPRGDPLDYADRDRYRP
jgi:hypothetical protein